MKYGFSLLIAALTLSYCSTSKKTASRDDGKITLTIIQVNDVYEIAPLSGGEYGGMARVATLKNQELKKNPNTLLIMAGDFLSPSVYNSLKYQGQRIRGAQMVDAMNAAGFDIAVFGNHEFDITASELQQRLNESTFNWISSNSFYQGRDSVLPFAKQILSRQDTLPAYRILTIKDADGTTARVGFLGINIPANKAVYVHYTDPLTTAVTLYHRIKDSCDIVIPITHQTIYSDSVLATLLPNVPVIIGGHEHDMRFTKVGHTYITKAHANARTAFVIDLRINKINKTCTVNPRLEPLDSTVALSPSTDSVVSKWTTIAAQNYASLGFDPNKIVLTRGDSLDGRDAVTRDTSTNLTRLIVAAMAAACPEADAVILNSGSIRLDDVLYPPVSQYDVLRALPFGGPIREVDMKGKLLRQVIEAGEKNKGSGGFLQYTPGLTIDPARTYRVGLSDFLLTGGEANLDFLSEKNPLITKIYPEETANTDPRSDIRLAVVRYMGISK